MESNTIMDTGITHEVIVNQPSKINYCFCWSCKDNCCTNLTENCYKDCCKDCCKDCKRCYNENTCKGCCSEDTCKDCSQIDWDSICECVLCICEIMDD